MSENPIKRWLLQTLSTVFISLVSLYTKTVILHFALAFVKRFYLFLPFLSPHPPSHALTILTHTHSPILFLLRTQIMGTGDDSWGGGEDRSYFFLKILAIFLLTHSYLVRRQPRSYVYQMILFHSSLSSSLSLLNLTYSSA